MKELSIPLLTEQDIDCRVQSVSGNRIREARLKKRLSQADFAAKLHYGTSADRSKQTLPQEIL